VNARESNGNAAGAGRDHDRVRYVATLYALMTSGRSGVLEVESGPRWRKLYLLAGQPVWYESNLEAEGLAKALVSSGILSQRQLNWVQSKLSEGEDLGDALVAAGTLSEEDMDAARQAQIERGYAAPLSWASGTCRFTPCDVLDPGRVDPALRREIEPLRALWEGVRHHVQMDDALQVVTDPDAGPVLLADGFAEAFPRLGVEEALRELPEAAAGSPTVEDVFKRIPDRSGNLAKLLWLLQIVELVARADGADSGTLADARQWLGGIESPPEIPTWLEEETGDTDGDLGDTAEDLLGAEVTDEEISLDDGVRVTTVSEPDPSGEVPAGAQGSKKRSKKKRPSRTPEETAELLRSAHRHRMGKDYYAFLGVSPTASLAEIKKAYGRLYKRCKKARATEGLPADAKELAKEMLNAARRVWLTLSDDTLRAAYNRRLDTGDAPVVRGRKRAATARLKDPETIPPKPASSSAPMGELPAYEQAKILMANGDHERARKLLERARQDSPSSPEILADLGWCTWMVQGRTTGDASSAEEYLRLAVAFNPRHEAALEFLARIAVERGDNDNARSRVKALLRVTPNSAWGTHALQQLGRASGSQPEPSGRLKFWKKKR